MIDNQYKRQPLQAPGIQFLTAANKMLSGP